MPKELYDSDGKKIEVPTEEELEAKQEEIRQQARKDAESDFASEKEQTQKEMDSLKEKLEKAQEKDQNFSKIREKTQEQEKEKEENQNKIAELEKKIDEKSQETRGVIVESMKSDAIKELVGDDEELIKAIDENYKRISGPEDTKEQITAKVKEAHAILEAQVGVNDDVMPGESGGGSRKVGEGGPKKSDVSPEAREMAAKRFGITDKDFDTHLK